MSRSCSLAVVAAGSLANPRRLDCHNRNVWVPGEEQGPDRHPGGPGHRTPFIGGFFVLEPRRVPLEIRPAGGRPVREVISFFAGDC